MDPVVIRFTEAGLPDIERAFTTIEQRMVRLEQTTTRETERGSKARVRAAQQEAEGRERAAVGAARATDRADAQATRDQEQRARYLDGVRRRSSEMAGRLAAQQAREEERAARQAAREIERLEEQKMRVRIRSSEMAGRIAAQEARAEEAARTRVSRAIGANAGRSFMSGIGRTVGTAASLAGGALAIGGGFALADIAGQELSAQRQAALLVNAVTTGKAPPPGANVGSILARAGVTSAETGMSKEELISGTLEYSRKARGGDFAGAMANMGFFAKMAKTTGTDIRDIAAAAGTLQSQNPDLKAPEMQQMLLDVYAQGKAGSMSMIDVAKQIGILSSTRSSFAGNAADNQRKLLALGQLAAPEGTVEEAGTFIKNLSAEAGAHRKSTKETVGLEQMGVKFDKFGRMESPEQMIEAVFRGTGGDITKIEKIFGLRGTALFRSLQPEFSGAGGGEAGIRAIRAKMASVTGATMTSGDLQAQFEQLMSTPAERLHTTFVRLGDIVAARLEPMLSHFADTLDHNGPAIERFMKAMLDLAEWLIANPWKGLGLAVTAAVTKDLAEAAIGGAVRTAITQLIAGSAAATAGGAMTAPVGSLVRSGAGGMAAAAGGVVGAGAVGAGLGFLLSEAMVSHQTDVMRGKSAGDLSEINAATALFGKARSGSVTPEDIAKAQGMVAQLHQREASGQAGVTAAHRTSFLPWVGQGAEADAARELKQTQDTLRLFERALRAATAALNGHAGAVTSNTAPGNASRNVPISQRAVP